MIRYFLFGGLISALLLGFTSLQADDEKPAVRDGEKPAQRDGEKPAKRGGEQPVKRDGEKPGEKPREGGEKPGQRNGEDGSIRATLKSVDLNKGVITVVISGDGGSSTRTFNLAGKDVKVSGITEKLSDLREGVQVFLQLSAEDDVLAIRTAKSRPTTKTGRIFAAYDKSGDGKVNFDEWLSLKEGVDAARRARERVYFDGADTNKDGTISFPEFENWMENRGRQPEARPAPAPIPNLDNPLPKK